MWDLGVIIKILYVLVSIYHMTKNLVNGWVTKSNTSKEVHMRSIKPHETARYGEIASAILNFFVCCMEMG